MPASMFVLWATSTDVPKAALLFKSKVRLHFQLYSCTFNVQWMKVYGISFLALIPYFAQNQQQPSYITHRKLDAYLAFDVEVAFRPESTDGTKDSKFTRVSVMIYHVFDLIFRVIVVQRRAVGWHRRLFIVRNERRFGWVPFRHWSRSHRHPKRTCRPWRVACCQDQAS